jgi:hypothetical protein
VKSSYGLHCLEILREYGTTELPGNTHANNTNSWPCGRCLCVIHIEVLNKRIKGRGCVALVIGLMRATQHLHDTHQIIVSIRDIFPGGWST